MKHLAIGPFIVALIASLTTHAAVGGPTPLPGGANQVTGVSATFPDVVFNGFVRITPEYFGIPRPQEGVTETPADPSLQVLVFNGTISDGSTKPYLDNPLIVLSDQEGVAITARRVQPNGIILQQAAGANLIVEFWVPKTFVPDHLTYTCQSARCKAIRITFKH